MPKVISSIPSIGDPEKQARADALLKKMHEASIEEEAATLAAKNGLSYIDLHLFPLDPEDLALIPKEDAKKHEVALFQKTGETTHIAIVDPGNQATLEYVQTLASGHGWDTTLHVVSRPSFEKALAAYTRTSLLESLDLIRVNLSGNDLEKFEENFGALLQLKDNLHQTSVSNILEVILAGAKKMKASDIHIEPEEDDARLRYRIDGVLQDVGKFSPDIYHLALSRIKMLGKMRLNVRDRAQDGHFFVTMDEKRIDIRVNSIPGKHGESLNMRLLSSDDIIVEVEDLGLRGLAYEEVRKQIEKPHGMILNTGPTGSGKTTTLYSLLNTINQPGVKIITVEDPIEYNLPGILQTEVSKSKSYTFAQALRAVVRQDPDVILVGEIRDDETADIAINAALTGHLVLSTLHANSAPASIPRLLELGVKPNLITSSVNALIAQRLVRKLCPSCRESYAPAEETVASLKQLISIVSPKAKITVPKTIDKLWKAAGCAECHFTGYRGRIGIFEVFVMSPTLIKIINDLGTEDEITKVALEDGMITMTQDGILKAIEGITTFEEVWRVADQGDMLKKVYAELMPSALSSHSFLSPAILAETETHLASLDDLAAYVGTIDQQTFLKTVFAAALLLRAGDIHIEPTEENVLVRYRIDGILKNALSFPLDEYPAILGQIKIFAGLKSGERAGVTDGRFSLTLQEPYGSVTDTKIDVRLSLILGGFGETVVMRLLNKSATSLKLESLDIRQENLDRILEAVKKPYGIILNAGPTGSGKTTTLYSLLSHINTPEIKIITVEDPIEYQIPGLLQTQINEADGYTFATALRSLLRQNPDILMIGEIRDQETAGIAVQAAVTGHLVLSTLHANNASGTIPRLLGMGISSDDLANAGNAFIAQRLVRRLCDHCKEKSDTTPEERALMEKIIATLPPALKKQVSDTVSLFRAKGCPECNGSGFNGQVIISEVLSLDKDIAALITQGALAHEIESKAIENGMITLAQDGILSVLEGKTTLEEIERVTEE